MEINEYVFIQNALNKKKSPSQGSTNETQYSYIPMPKTNTLFLRANTMND